MIFFFDSRLDCKHYVTHTILYFFATYKIYGEVLMRAPNKNTQHCCVQTGIQKKTLEETLARRGAHTSLYARSHSSISRLLQTFHSKTARFHGPTQKIRLFFAVYVV